MILRLVSLVRGRERRGLTGGNGAEQEQHEHILNPAVCPAPHG